eukprot:4812721-Alexandrium_andersonii.AAC.1
MDARRLSDWQDNPLSCPTADFPPDFPGATEPAWSVKEVCDLWIRDDEKERRRPQGQDRSNSNAEQSTNKRGVHGANAGASGKGSKKGRCAGKSQ